MILKLKVIVTIFFMIGFSIMSHPQNTRTTVLLIDTDEACKVTVDTKDIGIITPDHAQAVNVTPGQHIVKASIEGAPESSWRKVVEVKFGEQAAVLIGMKALHASGNSTASQDGVRSPAAQNASTSVPSYARAQFFGEYKFADRNGSTTGKKKEQYELRQHRTVTLTFLGEDAGSLKARLVEVDQRETFFPRTHNRTTDIETTEQHLVLKRALDGKVLSLVSCVESIVVRTEDENNLPETRYPSESCDNDTPVLEVTDEAHFKANLSTLNGTRMDVSLAKSF